ncbi:MAG: ATP-dependent Clp protease ATP-binding subunit [Leptolyngbyaceae cyanobacterium CRU_2_3]|nr:ATP-dependent Clp protease ATP-binding subunit [Leptolyngbyaceae cyanobacterium CRU_2_3]
MFEYFTEKAIAVVMAAQEEARRLGQRSVGTEQLLLGLIRMEGSVAAIVLTDMGVTLHAARIAVEEIVGHGTRPMAGEIPFTPKTVGVFERAFTQAKRMGQNHIAPEHLLLSLVQTGDSLAVKILLNLGIDPSEIQKRLGSAKADSVPMATGMARRDSDNPSSRTLPTLEEYGRNLTQLALRGELEPMVGRQRELERVVQILGRRTKNNPVLIGEPGVGKTAIAEGLAQRIASREIPEILLDQQVISLDMGALLAGTRFRGEFEERLSQIIAEVRRANNIILVIDEIHTLVGAGVSEGGMDAANMLKPALARGEFQVLGATTLNEYRQYIERDAALERRFQPVTVAEPTVEETIEMLRGLRSTYEQHHRVTFTDAALEAAAQLSNRYISDRFLPDKAIDLMDEAGSLVHLRQARHSPLKAVKRELQQITAAKQSAVKQQDFDQAGKLRDREMELEAEVKSLWAKEQRVKDLGAQEQGRREAAQQPISAIAAPVVVVEDIAHIVASWTGIPVSKLTESESVLLLHLEETLHNRVVGQEEAVAAVARAIRRARVGLGSPDRPIASLIFSGPTGVGKTELAKALATTIFGSEEAMIRLDMSEYMESHTVSKLIGSPPGFVGYDEGGQLTEAVRRKPYTVILLDEVEKAHPDVFNLLLQVLEEGHLTDSKGRTVSFKNTLLIMTSNIGSKVIEKGGGGLGFEFSTEDTPTAQYTKIRHRVQEEMKQYFRPELLNRLDEIIVFRQLQRDQVKQIADLLLQEVADRLHQQSIRLEVTEALKERVVAEGFSPSYGARPLRRAIARLLEDNLAEAMLAGLVKAGDTAIADVDEDNQVQIRPQSSPVSAGISS